MTLKKNNKNIFCRF